jgi:hypothetical protein
MNILIKLMSIVSLVIAPTLSGIFHDQIQAKRMAKIETMKMACEKEGCTDPACCSGEPKEEKMVETTVTSTDGVLDSASIKGTLKDGDFIADLGPMIDVKLANGKVLKVGTNSVEKKMVDFIQSGTIDSTSKKTWFTCDRLQFELGKEYLKKSSEEQVANIAAMLDAYPDLEIKLGGYTDNTGDAASNLLLSSRRAKNVMSQIIAVDGAAFTRIKAEGYGMEFPLADNASEIGRAMNRRIDIRIIKK